MKKGLRQELESLKEPGSPYEGLLSNKIDQAIDRLDKTYEKIENLMEMRGKTMREAVLKVLDSEREEQNP